jgi:hypothetical protein
MSVWMPALRREVAALYCSVSLDLSSTTKIWVAYLQAADNYDGPLAIRLKGCHQPVIRTPNGFSTPHSTLLAGI